MHPILIAALAEDRRRRCPCGAITQDATACPRMPGSRGLATQDLYGRGSALPTTHARTAKAWLLARVASLLQPTTKGAES